MTARSIHVQGVVQGVGFRPFVYRLARENALAGWVRNEESGVDIQVEGAECGIEAFLRDLRTQSPRAASITTVAVAEAPAAGLESFTICESRRDAAPTAPISPDLPVCEECLVEMRDPANPRFGYAYINCTNCGPRYSIVEALPYDRPATVMRGWPMDALCEAEYHDPANRRFHAQPVACPNCGPRYLLDGEAAGAIERAAAWLREGRIVAVKGIGGYHLVCDARHAEAVAALRHRKFRKEKPFAVMAASLTVAEGLVYLSKDSRALLASAARPILLAPAQVDLANVAPDTCDLGVMLPYTPLHYLLFDHDAPDALVFTSANRSNEPIAYRDDDARTRLEGIADAFLTGEREIARRIDDSVARAGAFGPVILRRSRGYAPGAVARIPARQPIVALGADLKNTITVVAAGQAFVSQHIGDLSDYESLRAFRETVQDLTSMYEIAPESVLVAHDLHPEYSSTLEAARTGCMRRVGVQHHRAHIASVLAERQAWDTHVIGVSFDGTGYGDDGCIWGGEFFAGSVAEGFERVRHLRPANLPGGDAAAQWPVQCAAGFLEQLASPLDMAAAPFAFPGRYEVARDLLQHGVRVFPTTSAGRLFDAAAALLGFTGIISYEGQAAIRMEQLARRSPADDAYPFPDLDWRPLLAAVIEDRVRGRDMRDIARAFQRGVAQAIFQVSCELCEAQGTATVVLSGGVFQNDLLLGDLKELFSRRPISVWTNAAVPANDGGISLGQAAIAAFPEAKHA